MRPRVLLMSKRPLVACISHATQVAVELVTAEELVDRARGEAPAAIVLDDTACTSVAALAKRARAVCAVPVIVISRQPALDDVEHVICPDAALVGNLVRALRYVLGHAMRQTARCAPLGRVRIGDHALPILDLSEGGVRLPLHDARAEAELSIEFEDGRTLSGRARLLRRVDDTSCVYRFVELGTAARALLRSIITRATDSSASISRPVAIVASRPIFGTSPALTRVTEVVRRIAATDVSVLVLGETGTGKELVARAIHDGSPRAARELVAVNCAALPEALAESELFGHEAGAFTGAHKRKIGRIEQANGGTLFLDEIGDLPALTQAKLLRALQERTFERVGGSEPVAVDFRLVAATNHDLEADIDSKTFRRDLFYRLNAVTIELPPLRERGDDILLLANVFVARASARLGRAGVTLGESARQRLLAYAWPGNVRELENLCTRLVALANDHQQIDAEQLGLCATAELVDSPIPQTDLRNILEFCEREIVRRVLDRHGGNRTQAARVLGLSRQALQQRLARLRKTDEVDAPR